MLTTLGQRLCQCSICLDNQVQLGSGKLTPGRIVTEREYSKHQKVQRKAPPPATATPIASSTPSKRSSTYVLSYLRNHTKTLPTTRIRDDVNSRTSATSAARRKQDKADRAMANILERVELLGAGFTERESKILYRRPLVFLAPTELHTTLPLLEPPRNVDPNDTGILALQYNAHGNKVFIDYEHWLANSIGELNRIKLPGEETAEGLVERMEKAFEDIQSWKVAEWIRQQEEFQLQVKMKSTLRCLKKTEGCSTFDNCEYRVQDRNIFLTASFSARHMAKVSTRASMGPTILACFLLAATLHIICGLSINDCSFLLPFLELIIRLQRNDSRSARRPHLLPKNIATIITSLDLEPKTRRFVSCTKCCKTYPIQAERHLDCPGPEICKVPGCLRDKTDARLCQNLHDPETCTIPNCPHPMPCGDSDYPELCKVPGCNHLTPTSIPESCTYRKTQGSEQCGQALFKARSIKGTERKVYVRDFLYYEVKEWIGSMLSRPGMEKLMDRDVLRTSDDSVQRDIFDGSVLMEFKGKDGTPFLSSHGKDGRYVFSLCVDGFNPFENKQAGKKVSSTGIYMACLNLPPDQRYKMENMYLVGVVPGPKEPSLDQINHFLAPLVQDLKELWDPGCWFSSTHEHPDGRMVNVALVPLVCDLKAARAVAGFGSHSSKAFCSVCQLKNSDINRLDYMNWTERTFEDHKKYAEEWKNAADERAQKTLFETHYVRWSVLLELPYWDATLFTLIDTMHTILLGNLHRHCRHIWGMNSDLIDGDGSQPMKGRKPPRPPSEEEMVVGATVLQMGSKKELEKISKKVLKQLCADKDVLPPVLRDQKKKSMLLEALLQYVSHLIFIKLSF